MWKILISYRRDDSAGHAQHLHGLLVDRFGRDNVFMDVESISPGARFDDVIDQHIADCDVCLVLIGNRWFGDLGNGRRRLDAEDDFVRHEVSRAIARHLHVVPVLLDGAKMPREEQLPAALRPLAKRHAFSVPAGRSLRSTSSELIEYLEQHFRESEPRSFEMECPKCGRALTTWSNQTFVECSNCHTLIATLQPRDEVVSPLAYDPETREQILRSLHLAAIDMENRNYRDALRAYEQLQRQHPGVWEAALNRAICMFWLGREDLTHLADVVSLLAKAAQLSGNHPRVDDCRRMIAYNLALLGAIKERLGTNISWSLQLFELSCDLEGELDERDDLIGDYIESCYLEIEERLLNLLEKQGKRFDPPMTELKTLHQINRLAPRPEWLSFLGAIAQYKLGNKYNEEKLERMLEETESQLMELTGEVEYPRFVFPRFGRPRLE